MFAKAASIVGLFALFQRVWEYRGATPLVAYPGERAGRDVALAQVSRWMGHANVSKTDGVYCHMYPSDYTDQIARFEAFVAEA